MRRTLIGILLGFGLLPIVPASAADYLPPKGDAWATHTPHPAFQAAFLDDAAGGDHLFVEAVAVARDHRKAGVGEHGGGAQRGAGDGADGDAVDLLAVGRRARPRRGAVGGSAARGGG